MRAIRAHSFGEPDVLTCEEVPDPEPGPGQVRVRIHAAGVNPVDTYILSGTYARKPTLPYVPGTDGAGEIETVGDGVTRVRPGDRVYVLAASPGATGTYAERTVCREADVHRLPDEVSYPQGAAVGVPYATAYHALFQVGGARPGDILLVHGASGGVGVAAVQLARAHGLVVIGTAGSDRGRELVRLQGADHVLDHTKAGYLDEVRTLTDGRGPGLILEMLANVNLAHDLDLVAPEGRIVVVGSRGAVEIAPRLIMAKRAVVTGMTLWAVPPGDAARIHAALAAGLASGVLRPVVGQQLPLSKAAEAHRAVMAPGAYGKIVLVC